MRLGTWMQRLWAVLALDMPQSQSGSAPATLTTAPSAAGGVAAGAGGHRADVIIGAYGQAVARELQQALPPVSAVDFQDLDLDAGEVAGTVLWTPPPNAAEVSAYEVYLSDGEGSLAVQAHIGTVAVGTNTLTVAANTTLTTPSGNRTHIFVFTRSPLGVSPEGAGVELCDVRSQDTLFLVNAEETTAPWGVTELSFYAKPDCSGAALRWVQSGSTGHAGVHVHDNAFDGDDTSAWTSICNTCGEGEVSLGVLGVCRPQEVRCVRLQQCVRGSGTFGCPVAAGRLQQVRLLVQGEVAYTWKVLKRPRAGGNDNLRDELLTVVGRRRRAAFVAFSETPPRLEQFTSLGFTAR